MRKTICVFKKHTRGRTAVLPSAISPLYIWVIECKRCKHTIKYPSPRARLVGTEIKLGFDGK